VYHHRRRAYGKHLGQIKQYALHRGYFAKRFPRTSLCIEYFIPSVFILFLVVTLLAALLQWPVFPFLFAAALSYCVLLVFSSFVLGFSQQDNLLKRFAFGFFTAFGIFFTHLVYGIFFMKGLCAKNMPEEIMLPVSALRAQNP
jgi:hypothetical protein